MIRSAMLIISNEYLNMYTLNGFSFLTIRLKLIMNLNYWFEIPFKMWPLPCTILSTLNSLANKWTKSWWEFASINRYKYCESIHKLTISRFNIGFVCLFPHIKYWKWNCEWQNWHYVNFLKNFSDIPHQIDVYHCHWIDEH